jgi:hypothetical protein
VPKHALIIRILHVPRFLSACCHKVSDSVSMEVNCQEVLCGEGGTDI